jgi:hypothetical protein
VKYRESNAWGENREVRRNAGECGWDRRVSPVSRRRVLTAGGRAAHCQRRPVDSRSGYAAAMPQLTRFGHSLPKHLRRLYLRPGVPSQSM